MLFTFNTGTIATSPEYTVYDPDPDIVIELVEKSDVTNGCSYRYRLKNLDEYNKTDKKYDK